MPGPLPERLRSRTGIAALVGMMLVLAALRSPTTAEAQTIRPVSPPPSLAPKAPAAAPAPALPPPLTGIESRFRRLADYIRARGAIDAGVRADLSSLAADLDASIASEETTDAARMRLLAARAQTAIWLVDHEGMDAAFEGLLAQSDSKDALLLAWARELVLDARFEKAAALLQGHSFEASREIEAKITLGRALLGLMLLDDAQAVLNTAPAKGRSREQMAAIGTCSKTIGQLRASWNKELTTILEEQEKGDNPIVEIMTSKGPVSVELFEDQAPGTVGHFIEHVEAGTYAGTSFHGVHRGLGLLGGDPATREGGPGGASTGGWTVPDEGGLPDHRPLVPGRLILLKQPDPVRIGLPKPNSAGCQFMILLSPAPQLDGEYTAFGRVIDGMDIVHRLRAGDQILAAEVISKRPHEYRANRLSNEARGEFRYPIPIGTRERSATPAATQPPPILSPTKQ